MGTRRLEQIPGFSIDRVAAAAGDDPDFLRLENSTPNPAPAALWRRPARLSARTTQTAGSRSHGRDDMKDASGGVHERRGGPHYDGRREIVITSGGGTRCSTPSSASPTLGRGHPHRPRPTQDMAKPG